MLSNRALTSLKPTIPVVLVYITLLASVLVLTLYTFQLPGWVWVIKPLPSLVLVWAGWRWAPRSFAWGLTFGAIGDVALAPLIEPLFPVGMAAFALGHIAYVVYLRKGQAWHTLQACVAAAVWLATLGVLVPVVEHQWEITRYDVALATPLYAMLLATMATLAIGKWGTPGGPMLAGGALLFWASDGCIAFNFLMGEPAKGWLLATGVGMYFVGQGLMLLGCARQQIVLRSATMVSRSFAP